MSKIRKEVQIRMESAWDARDREAYAAFGRPDQADLFRCGTMEEASKTIKPTNGRNYHNTSGYKPVASQQKKAKSRI